MVLNFLSRETDVILQADFFVYKRINKRHHSCIYINTWILFEEKNAKERREFSFAKWPRKSRGKGDSSFIIILFFYFKDEEVYNLRTRLNTKCINQ